MHMRCTLLQKSRGLQPLTQPSVSQRSLQASGYAQVEGTGPWCAHRWGRAGIAELEAVQG